MKTLICWISWTIVVSGCNYRRVKMVMTSDVPPTYASVKMFIIDPKCIGCHMGNAKLADLSSYSKIMATPGLVAPGDPEGSELYKCVQTGRMPKEGERLRSDEIALIANWIRNGALESDVTPDPPPAPTYEWISKYVFERKCYRCHDGAHPKNQFDMRTYESLMAYEGQLMPAIFPADPTFSSVYVHVNAGTMPPPDLGGTKLKQEEIDAIGQWITEGALKGTE